MSGPVIPPCKGSELKHRSLSGLVLVPLVLGLTWWGGWPFTILWTFAGLAVLYEWAAMGRLERQGLWLGINGAALIASVILTHQDAPLAYGALIVLAGAVLGALVVPKCRIWSFWGGVIAGAAILPILILRGNGEPGIYAVFYLYAVVWATDIFAYFVGRALGGPKLWPKVSPNKTWSGALGGMLAAALAAGLLAYFSGLPNVVALMLLAVPLSIVSQAGDLAESAIKRVCGVKDASRLIPGHGGILDRLDGFTVAALVAVLIALVRMAEDPATGLLFW